MWPTCILTSGLVNGVTMPQNITGQLMAQSSWTKENVILDWAFMVYLDLRKVSSDWFTAKYNYDIMKIDGSI